MIGKIINIYFRAILISGLCLLSSCGSSQVGVPIEYHPDELEVLRACMSQTEDELLCQAYDEGDAAALYYLGIRDPLEDGKKANREKARGLISASASLGFAPAFLALADISYQDSNPWAFIVFTKIAMDMGHEETSYLGYFTLERFGKQKNEWCIPALFRDVARIKEMTSQSQSQFQDLQDVEARRNFIQWLINEGGLTAEGPKLCFTPLPGDWERNRPPVYRVTPEGDIPIPLPLQKKHKVRPGPSLE